MDDETDKFVNKFMCDGDCKICKLNFGSCSLTRSGSVFKRDDDTRDTGDTRYAGTPRLTKKDACPVCHSDLRAKHPHPPSSGWYCVLCGYEEDENGKALL